MLSYYLKRNKIDKIFLHIGFHKTGTSYIQQSLYKNKELLKKNGISLICLSTYKREMDQGNAMYLVRRPKRLISKLQKAKKIAIISSEDMSWWNENKIIELKKVLNKFSHKVKIITYLRNHDEYAISMKQQGAKAQHIAKIFGHSESLLPDLTEKVIYQVNYYNNLKKWSQHFGKDNLMITTFDYLKSHNIKLIDNFLHKINADNIKLKEIPRKNESIDYYWQKFLHKNQSFLWVNKKLRNYILPEIINTGNTKNKKIISLEESKKFRQYFLKDIENLKDFDNSEVIFNFFPPKENVFIYQQEKYDEVVSKFIKIQKEASIVLYKKKIINWKELKKIIITMNQFSNTDALALCDNINTYKSLSLKKKLFTDSQKIC